MRVAFAGLAVAIALALGCTRRCIPSTVLLTLCVGAMVLLKLLPKDAIKPPLPRLVDVAASTNPFAKAVTARLLSFFVGATTPPNPFASDMIALPFSRFGCCVVCIGWLPQSAMLLVPPPLVFAVIAEEGLTAVAGRVVMDGPSLAVASVMPALPPLPIHGLRLVCLDGGRRSAWQQLLLAAPSLVRVQWTSKVSLKAQSHTPACVPPPPPSNPCWHRFTPRTRGVLGRSVG